MFRALVVTSALVVVFACGSTSTADAKSVMKPQRSCAVEIKYTADGNWLRLCQYPTYLQAYDQLVWLDMTVLADARIVAVMRPGLTVRPTWPLPKK